MKAAGAIGTDFRGAPACQPFDDRAQVVHVLHVIRLQRRHDQPAARGVVQYALSSQQRKRLLDRLARHAEGLGNRLLDDSVPGADRTARDLAEDGVANLLDSGNAPALRNSEFSNTATSTVRLRRITERAMTSSISTRSGP